jgi:hypothetical protein
MKKIFPLAILWVGPPGIAYKLLGPLPKFYSMNNENYFKYKLI